MKTLITFLVLTLSTVALADSNYYPASFIEAISSNRVVNDELKEEIHNVLTSNHQRDPRGGRDTLGCESGNNCYRHISLGYDGARKILFGKIHLVQNGSKYYIKDVYCRKEFASGANVKPGAIPNHAQINCEHTWPQSKFSGNYSKDLQKSDLHHLYPTDSRANSVRGNFPFADISHENGNLEGDCDASKSGDGVMGGSDRFEPPTEHKGNVARALFYFSVRYKIKMQPGEEETMRRWHEIDPVDAEEMKRNDEIQKAQGNRNPFIDFPQLVNSIKKF